MNEKQYILRLGSINYVGDDIGNDLIFTIILGGYGSKTLEFERKIDHDDAFIFSDFVVFEQRISQAFTQNIVVSIVEDDKFDDRGSGSGSAAISLQAGKTDIQVTVFVKGDAIGDPGKTAEIILNFEAEVVDLSREGEEELPPSEPFPYPGMETIIRNTPYPVVAFVSDLHIGADRCVDDFDNSDDGQFVAMLTYLKTVLAAAGSQQMDLVLLGDVLEMWETKNYATRFDSREERRAKARFKVDKIAGKHATVFSELAKFAGSGGVTVHYIYGNHDDEVIDPQLRSHLGQATKVPFQYGDGGQAISYTNRRLELFARHGHQDDKYNFSDDPFDHGKRPLGRWIVENFVTRLELSADAQCRSPFANIDAFEPLSQYDNYVACLRKNGSLPDVRFQDVQAAARNLNANAPAGIGAKLSKTVIEPFLTLVGQDALDKFAIFKGIAEFLGAGEVTAKNAKKLLTAANGNPSCILFGHTHAEEITPIGGDSYYVNTGTWQDKQAHNESNPCAPLALPNRHLTLLVRADATDAGESESGEARVFIYMVTFPGPIPRFGRPVSYRLKRAG